MCCKYKDIQYIKLFPTRAQIYALRLFPCLRDLDSTSERLIEPRYTTAAKFDQVIGNFLN